MIKWLDTHNFATAGAKSRVVSVAMVPAATAAAKITKVARTFIFEEIICLDGYGDCNICEDLFLESMIRSSKTKERENYLEIRKSCKSEII